MTSPLRCLVVDDSTIYRKIVRDALDSAPDVEVVGASSDGVAAVEMIRSKQPDLVTLDLEMPNLDGIGVLREIKRLGLQTSAIMVSAFTANGAKATTEALGLGAFDFILKPSTKSPQESIQLLRSDLLPKLAAARTRQKRSAAGARLAPKPNNHKQATVSTGKPRFPRVRPEIIAIGVSTGGPQALGKLLPRIPKTFPLPIVIVQHMPAMFTKSLAEELDRQCSLSVCEATEGLPVRPGQIVIAPGGKQMRIAKSATGNTIQLTDDPPERNCKPAADFLFRSVASCYGPRALGVVLTGMGDDGTVGARTMKTAGASIIAQDESSCVVYGMPKSIVDTGLADDVLPLNEIHQHLIAAAAGRVFV